MRAHLRLVGQVLAREDGTVWFWLPFAVSILVLTGLDVITPGEMLVVEFFGRYRGTVARPGFWLVAPFHHRHRRRASIRVRNFETAHLKVNDADGNPVEMAAIVVWQVVDTAKATYAVENYRNFVTVQAESAVRHGTVDSSVVLGGRKVPMRRPWVRRDAGSGEVSLPAYELFSSAEVLSQMAMERMLAKLFTRGYPMASQSTRPASPCPPRSRAGPVIRTG